jgi:hypothetical protein
MNIINIIYNNYLTRIFALLLIFGLSLPKIAIADCRYVDSKLKILTPEIKYNLSSPSLTIKASFKNFPKGEKNISFFIYNKKDLTFTPLYNRQVNDYNLTLNESMYFPQQSEEGEYWLAIYLNDEDGQCLLIEQPFYITDYELNKCINKYKREFGDKIASCSYRNLNCQKTSGIVSKIAVDHQNYIVYYFYNGKWYDEQLTKCY